MAADPHHLLHRAGEGEGRFLDILDRVLELLITELVPYTVVVRAVCGGSLERNCGFCGGAVTVRKVAVGQLVRVAQVAIYPTAIGLVSCTQPACARRLEKLEDEDIEWFLQGTSLSHLAIVVLVKEGENLTKQHRLVITKVVLLSKTLRHFVRMVHTSHFKK